MSEIKSPHLKFWPFGDANRAWMLQEIAVLRTQLAERDAEIVRLREALRFYAYPGAYTGRPAGEEMRKTARALLGPREARGVEE